ncbi:bifunctional lysylphosphatidylglycerol flippase/synthetase MprF [Pseudonocardia sp. GCM10023141]|uniref:bifunctional lysylphosphatidylglycerol flippase/synthetase MprF n=1 Tax=Pseudonocardia sp. GCM10023141 TaxID=3252653 RepID=UPI00360F8523
MAEQTATAATARTATLAGPARRVLDVWRRLPFTTTVVALMLITAVATGALWRAAEDAGWYPQIAYGVPSMVNGRWWTLFSGPFLAIGPWYYVPMAGGFALLVGFAEWRLGTRLAASVTIVGHLVGVLGAILFLLAVGGTDWTWAQVVAGRLDVGFSAGALTAAAVTTAVLRPPWRLRVRIALGIYLVVAVLYVGSFADLEHLVAAGIGLAVGPRITRGLGPRPVTRPSRREWRLLAVAGLLMVAVIMVVTWLLPSDGPLGSTADPEQTEIDVLVTLVLVGLLILGLRRGRRTAWWWAVSIAGLNVLLGLLVAGLVAVAVFFDLRYELDGVPIFVADRLLWTALLVVLLVGRRAFRVPSRRRLRRQAGDGATRDTVVDLLKRSGGSTLSWMSTWPENSWFLTADGATYIAYQRHAGVAIALGDPVGPPEGRAAAVVEYAAMCERSGLMPCLFSVTQPLAQAAAAVGWQHVQVAEDTLVDLPDLQFKGKSWQDVRSALNKAGKEGVTFRMVNLSEERWSLVNEVRAVSQEWAGDKGLPEMGFTLGGIDEALDPEVRVGLAEDEHGAIQGVTSWLPVYGPDKEVHGWTLDVMRRRHDGFRPVVEFLIASSCLTFQAEGAAFVSLSGAPLARTGKDDEAAVLDRLLDTLGAALEPLYGFRSLHAFKTKFKPRYVPMHLAYRDEADLPRIGIDLTRAYLPDTPLRELLMLTRGGSH